MLKAIQVHLTVLVLLIRMIFIDALPVDSGESALNFILLHNNDLHGRFAESTIDGPDCRPEEALANKCYGGFARISSIVKRYRSEQDNENGLPVLFLNGGDTYVGTPWFQLFKHRICVEFMNALKPDVGVSAPIVQFIQYIFLLFNEGVLIVCQDAIVRGNKTVSY